MASKFQMGFDPIVFELVRWDFRTGCFSIIGDLENNPCFDMVIFQYFNHSWRSIA